MLTEKYFDFLVYWFFLRNFVVLKVNYENQKGKQKRSRQMAYGHRKIYPNGSDSDIFFRRIWTTVAIL